MSEPSRPTVLVVDDQPANVHVLAEALRDRCEVLFAVGGEKALEIVERQHVDLILLDVVMPELDGFEVCRRLKAREASRDIPVIFVTSANEVDDETRGFDAGGVDYIAKPVSVPIVRARVRTHLELKEQRELLERMAWLDPLTGIPNRRRFEETFDREWRHALRRAEPLTLLMADVDHFKAYNDDNGHPLGDECLRSVARALRGTLRRTTDLVARYGGEEFVVVAPDTPGIRAATLVDRLLADVRRLAISRGGANPEARVTVSVGGATTVPTIGRNPADLVAAADRMLYRMKEGGRDRGAVLDVDRDEIVAVEA